MSTSSENSEEIMGFNEKNEKDGKPKRKSRRSRPFPGMTFEEALLLPNAVQKHASGQKVRRLTLFDALNRSPDSRTSRNLVTASNQYNLTIGGYRAEYLELTKLGKKATSLETSEKESKSTMFQLAIEHIKPFNLLYESFKNNRVPSKEVMCDKLLEEGVDEDFAKEGVDIFILNGHFLGIITEIAGAERIVPIEQVLEGLSTKKKEKVKIDNSSNVSDDQKSEAQSETETDWDKICFYITPIGADDSEQRQHSDLFLGSIIEPVIDEFKMKVIRADKIEKPGIITAQIIEYLLKSKLVIADLSYHNPNVFYELSLRHACRLPTVQVIRKTDKIPFDLDQFRTIQIDTSSIYSLVPKLETYKTAISNQIRKVIENPDLVDSPISIYYPKLKVHF